jgi:hypothetical protein
VLPVELHDFRRARGNAEVIENAHVDGVELRRAAGTRKHVDAARAAEVMLRLPSAELIGGKVIFTAQEAKARGFDGVVQCRLLATDGAVALNDTLDWPVDLEADSPAVAGASVRVRSHEA